MVTHVSHPVTHVPELYGSDLAFVSAPPPPPPTYQNYMVVALLLLILSVIPSRTTVPPRSWQRFYEEREALDGDVA